jgi:ribulose-bisphosphate carboxylase large chain
MIHQFAFFVLTGRMSSMASERVQARYRIETPLPVERAAKVLAGEQSSGTFIAVPGETDELRERFGARVEEVSHLEPVSAPSLPGSRSAGGGQQAAGPTPLPSREGLGEGGASKGKKFNRAEIRVSWPIENFGHNLPVLVSTLQGNLYELSQFSGLKLIDFEVPESFARAFAGPRFGVDGTRRLMNVNSRPMIGTIIKPSVGLSPDQTANLVRQLAEADIDFIKDDELMANPPHSPFPKRLEAVMRVINDHADRTGKRIMYAANITGEIDDMLRHYELIQQSGNTCAMVSLNTVGLAGVKKLCDQGALAIHGHRNGWGMLNRHPWLGMEFPAYQKLWRLAGVDQVHVNGIANKFWEDDDSVVRSIEACLRPMAAGQQAAGGGRILPVVSSGQTGLQAPETYRRTKTVDLLYLAGGGIMAHPGGPAAGVTAIRQAWEAAVAGVSLEQYAEDHTELRQQLDKFGSTAQYERSAHQLLRR